jgi:hypothetical protein
LRPWPPPQPLASSDSVPLVPLQVRDDVQSYFRLAHDLPLIRHLRGNNPSGNRKCRRRLRIRMRAKCGCRWSVASGRLCHFGGDFWSYGGFYCVGRVSVPLKEKAMHRNMKYDFIMAHRVIDSQVRCFLSGVWQDCAASRIGEVSRGCSSSTTHLGLDCSLAAGIEKELTMHGWNSSDRA